MQRRSILVTACVVICLISIRAQEHIDHDVYWKIRQEGDTRSQILRTLHFLTDVYGPRLTGSPNLKAAGEWAIKQLETWGLENGHLEPWDFGHAGWLNERLSVHIVSPVKDHLVSEALAWTPGTNGLVRGAAVQITIPTRPTKDELTAYLENVKDSVRGKLVLVGAPQRVLVTFNPPPLRREDRELLALYDPAGPATPLGAGAPAAQTAQAGQPPRQSVLNANQIDEQLNPFLIASQALVRINDAGRDHGQIRAFANRTYDTAGALPTVEIGRAHV